MENKIHVAKKNKSGNRNIKKSQHKINTEYFK